MTSERQVAFRGRDGNAIAADETGDPAAPPVLLLHGGGQTRHAWGTTLQTLGGAGWHAYSIDLRGHGQSDWASDGDYSLDAFVGDLLAVIATLDERPALVGASLGGLTALTAVGEGTGLAAALVLVDVAPRIEEAGRDRIGAFMAERVEDGFGSLEEVADAIQRYNPHRPRPSDLSGLAKNLRQRPDGRWTWHWDPAFISGKFKGVDETRTMFDEDRLEDAARHLDLPTLLVRGRMSDLLSEEGAQQFLALAPHATMVDVAGAGHMVAGDRNDLFNRAIVDFLGGIGPSAGG